MAVTPRSKRICVPLCLQQPHSTSTTSTNTGSSSSTSQYSLTELVLAQVRLNRFFSSLPEENGRFARSNHMSIDVKMLHSSGVLFIRKSRTRLDIIIAQVSLRASVAPPSFGTETHCSFFRSTSLLVTVLSSHMSMRLRPFGASLSRKNASLRLVRYRYQYTCTS
jgi:hypothetical protein